MCNPGISAHWSASEQELLEDLIREYSSAQLSQVSKYAAIALHFEEKTMRDVALRVRWMMEKRISGDRHYSGINGGAFRTDTQEQMLQLLAEMSETLKAIIAEHQYLQLDGCVDPMPEFDGEAGP